MTKTIPINPNDYLLLFDLLVETIVQLNIESTNHVNLYISKQHAKQLNELYQRLPMPQQLRG